MSWRLILGLPIAALVVVVLFLVMNGLILTDDVVDGDPKDPVVVTITPDFEESEIERPSAVRPDLPDQPPPPPEEPRDAITPGDLTDGDPLPPRPDGTGTKIELTVPDRDAQPLVRVEPSGFERCFDSRTSGEQRVRLRFDVTPTGETSNIEVVSSTDRCFESSARRAVQRWRYAPKLEKGENVWRYGVETTIVYQLAE
ncbi:MAG: TonB family protein [Pseudomonadota bacterium]